MKLLDEKGRLFGKINIIDLIVLLVILFLVAAVGYKMLAPKAATSPIAKNETTFVVKLSVKPEKIAKNIKPGDKLVSGTSYISDAVVDSIKVLPGEMTTNNAQGVSLVSKHPSLKDIYITVKAKINTNDAVLKVGTQQLCQGKKFTFKTQLVEVEGTVDDIILNK